MKVKEYLTKIGISENSSKNLCFVIGEVINKTPNTKEIYYKISSMRQIWEWFESLDYSTHSECHILNFNVLNIKQPVISWLSGANWNPSINNGNCISLLVMSDEELGKYYSEQQRKSILEYIDKKIEKIISK